MKVYQIKSNQMWIYIAHCQKISNALIYDIWYNIWKYASW